MSTDALTDALPAARPPLSTAPAVTPSTSAAVLRDYAGLPGSPLLLEPAGLTELLGAAASPRRLRIKPGVSILSAHGPGPRAHVSEIGWALLVRARDKRDGILRRAARTGARVVEHDLAGPRFDLSELGEPDTSSTASGCAERREAGRDRAVVGRPLPYLLTGAVDSDPRLGKTAGSVLRRIDGAAEGTDDGEARVLSYNPARHLLLELPASGQVLRIATRPLTGLQSVTEAWTRLGLPTLPQRTWRGRSDVLVSDQWGSGDLTTVPDAEARVAAERSGALIASLHAATQADGAPSTGIAALPAARIGDLIPVAITAVTELLPHHATLLHQLAEQLANRLPARPATALIHGDLSPDQILVAGADQRVIDLDRSGIGPVGADLGSWLAWSLAADRTPLAEAFLAGYANVAPPIASKELAAWTARALLSAALDPLRRGSPQWLDGVEHRIDLAAALLESPELLEELRPDRAARAVPALSTTVPYSGPAAPAATPLAAAQPMIPEYVQHDGERLRVRRAWADDGRGIPLELELDLELCHGRGHESGTAGPDGGAVGASGAATLRAARLDAATGAVTVHRSGTDPRLPALERVLAAHSGSVVASHRPGKRAVVRTAGPDAAAGGAYVKIVRPGRAARIVDAIERATPFAGPFRTPQVLAADNETVTFAALTGAALHEPLPIEDGTWGWAWNEVLSAWSAALEQGREAHAASSSDSMGDLHGPAEEASVLTAWLDRAALVDPDGRGARNRAVEAAREALAQLDVPARPALIHRDLHDKQLLWDPVSGPALLDVDTAAIGDPALDLANLRAHATWRQRQGLWSPEHTRIVRKRIDVAATAAGLDPAALLAYELGSLARLTCVYAYRPQWRDIAHRLAVELGAGR